MQFTENRKVPKKIQVRHFSKAEARVCRVRSPRLDVFCLGCRTSRRHRSPYYRPPPAGLSRHAGARLAVLMVSKVGADAEATRLVRSAASEAGRRRGPLTPARPSLELCGRLGDEVDQAAW